MKDIDPWNLRLSRRPVRCLSGVMIAPGLVGYCWETPLSDELLAQQAPDLAESLRVIRTLQPASFESLDAPGGDMDEVEYGDATDMMRTAARVLERWRARLQQTADRLESTARFAEGTDAPKNLEAAWSAELASLVDDELRTVSQRLARAAAWTDDPESWLPPK